MGVLLQGLSSVEDQLTNLLSQQETANGTAGVGVSMNNPGAIKYGSIAAANGATEGANGFASFPSLADGYSALKTLVGSYISSGASITSMINKYAPASDGNTNNAARIAQAASATGLDPNTPIKDQTSTIQDMIAAAFKLGTSLPGISAQTGKSNGVIDPSTGKPIDSSVSGGFLGLTWTRIAAFVVGLIALIIGLSSLKQTQFIVQPVIDTAKKGVAGAIAAP